MTAELYHGHPLDDEYINRIVALNDLYPAEMSIEDRQAYANARIVGTMRAAMNQDYDMPDRVAFDVNEKRREMLLNAIVSNSSYLLIATGLFFSRVEPRLARSVVRWRLQSCAPTARKCVFASEVAEISMLMMAASEARAPRDNDSLRGVFCRTINGVDPSRWISTSTDVFARAVSRAIPGYPSVVVKWTDLAIQSARCGPLSLLERAANGTERSADDGADDVGDTYGRRTMEHIFAASIADIETQDAELADNKYAVGSVYIGAQAISIAAIPRSSDIHAPAASSIDAIDIAREMLSARVPPKCFGDAAAAALGALRRVARDYPRSRAIYEAVIKFGDISLPPPLVMFGRDNPLVESRLRRAGKTFIMLSNEGYLVDYELDKTGDGTIQGSTSESRNAGKRQKYRIIPIDPAERRNAGVSGGNSRARFGLAQFRRVAVCDSDATGSADIAAAESAGRERCIAERPVYDPRAGRARGTASASKRP